MERDVFAGDSRGGRADDSMQVPTSATGHEEEAQAAATGHEEAQATATGQEKKSATTSDNERTLAEAPSSATGQRRRDDKPLRDPSRRPLSPIIGREQQL